LVFVFVIPCKTKPRKSKLF